MQPKRASWSDDDTKLLLDLYLQEKEKFNFNQQGLATTGWNNIYTCFPHYDKKQCNKLGSLKKAYLTWKDELSATRLGRDPRTGNIAADPEYWETQAGSQLVTSEDGLLEARHGRQPRFLDQLEALFGDRNRNTGCFMSADGIRESTPLTALRPLDSGGPSSYHSSSKRGTMDNVVNNPKKKKTHSVGEYMARLSESIVVKSTSRDREWTREHAEGSSVAGESEACWNMDNSDEDSQNSSENSFNEMVTAAMAGDYPIVYMLQVPPQVCDFDMRFTYIGTGTEGSAHDMRVKKKADDDASFPRPPSGRYYLVDSSYALRPRFLTPYPNKRQPFRFTKCCNVELIGEDR
ncbi:uncharacterized protein [Miscanthus floridulus]|uniref:uncharacterized protein n=1 Tax=Miscanthus floridulus TaxID=154761 RepID=UPI0034594FE3